MTSLKSSYAQTGKTAVMLFAIRDFLDAIYAVDEISHVIENRSLKIRPDFGVFLVADSVHFFQIIRASKWSRGNNSRS
jgi:hypothetical protein